MCRGSSGASRDAGLSEPGPIRERFAADLAALRQSFGGWARAYHEHRPGYPAAGFDLLADLGRRARSAAAVGPVDHDPQAVDLGAGTGILAAGLAARAINVVGVEPDERMCAMLAEVVGPGRAVAGTAEALPLADASADLVTAGQMWHWVDPERAVPEIARVLRPGGAFAICWTLRDDRVEWVARLAESVGLTDLYLSSATDRPVVLPAPFGELALTELDFGIPMDADRLVDQLGTYATVVARDAPRVLRAARDFLRTEPATAGEFVAPFVCKIFVAWRN